MKVFSWIGLIGFVMCLIIMYTTNHGIPGIRKHDPNFRLLDMQFHYRSDTVYDTFDKLGKEGRKAYQNYWILDFFFIVCFLTVQITVVNIIDKRSALRIILIMLSVLRGLFDVIENGILIYLIGKFPEQNNQLASFCSYMTTSKFIALYLWIIGIMIVLLYQFATRLKAGN